MVRNSAGNYTITNTTVAAATANLACVITPNPGSSAMRYCRALATSTTAITVLIYDDTAVPVPTDCDFSFMTVGR